MMEYIALRLNTQILNQYSNELFFQYYTIMDHGTNEYNGLS